MNNLDSHCPRSVYMQRQITDFHVLIRRLHLKPQKVQLPTGVRGLFSDIKFIRLIIYDELSLLPSISSLFWPSSSRCRPKIVRPLITMQGGRKRGPVRPGYSGWRRAAHHRVR
jgi:hypothetical protein